MQGPNVEVEKRLCLCGGQVQAPVTRTAGPMRVLIPSGSLEWELVCTRSFLSREIVASNEGCLAGRDDLAAARTNEDGTQRISMRHTRLRACNGGRDEARRRVQSRSPGARARRSGGSRA
jgi:hypothetical protein